MSRANTLSSSGVQQVEEETKIVDALTENGYPSSFIRKHLCPTRHRQEVDVRKPRTTVTLPYINGLSEAVRWILTQLDIKVVFHPLSPLRHMLVDDRSRLCTPYLVTDGPRYTLDRLAEPSDIDWQSIDGP